MSKRIEPRNTTATITTNRRPHPGHLIADTRSLYRRGIAWHRLLIGAGLLAGLVGILIHGS